MAITISGTDGIVGAGFTVDNSGVSVTAGVGTFSSVRGTHHGDGANLTSLPAAQLTGSLPAISAASCTSIPAANIVGLATAGFNRSGGFPAGVEEFDIWFLTASHSGNTNPITNNWSRWTSQSGTGTVTFDAPSSGIWTFPSTGFWKIEFTLFFNSDGNNSERGCNNYIYVTTNNSSYSTVTEASCSLVKADDNTNISKGHTLSSYIFDVTDTSTHKVKLSNGYNQRAGTVYGHGSYLYSFVKFIKLTST